jgi:hypothetical protein
MAQFDRLVLLGKQLFDGIDLLVKQSGIVIYLTIDVFGRDVQLLIELADRELQSLDIQRASNCNVLSLQLSILGFGFLKFLPKLLSIDIRSFSKLDL